MGQGGLVLSNSFIHGGFHLKEALIIHILVEREGEAAANK